LGGRRQESGRGEGRNGRILGRKILTGGKEHRVLVDWKMGPIANVQNKGFPVMLGDRQNQALFEQEGLPTSL